MAVILTPPKAQFFDNNGDPLSGGKIYSYEAGTTTPKATYTDAGGATPNANPVVLDSAGRADIWLVGSYKIVVKTSADATISTTDNLTAFNNTSATSYTDNTFTITDDADPTKALAFQVSGVPTGTTVTMTVPAANFTPIGASDTATLSNKTLDNSNAITVQDANFTIQDNSDLTKQLKTQLSGLTTATTRTYTAQDNDGTIALFGSATSLINGTKTVTLPSGNFTALGYTSENVLTQQIEGYVFFDDFDSIANWTATTSGAGSAAALTTSGSRRPGLVRMETGTTSGGYGGLLKSPQILTTTTSSGSQTTMHTRITSISALSDGTNTYTLRIGCMDSASAEPTNGIFFRYTHSANSGNWVCVCRASGVETTLNSSVAVATSTTYALQAIIDSNAANVTFYINGVSIGTTTTNIPTSVGYGMSIIKSAGTTNRTFDVDTYSLVKTISLASGRN